MWSELSSEQYSSPKGVTPLAATGAEQLSWHEMPSPHPGHPSRAMISFLPPSQKCPIWCPEHDCLLPSSLKLNILRGLGTAVDILLGTHHHQCILVFPHHPTKIPSLLGCPTKTWHNQRGRMEGTETSSWVRSWGLVPGAAVVWDGHDGLMQAVHHISMHIAILSAEPAHHHFRFLPAGFSGLRRKERIFIHFFYWEGWKRNHTVLLWYTTGMGAMLPRLWAQEGNCLSRSNPWETFNMCLRQLWGLVQSWQIVVEQILFGCNTVIRGKMDAGEMAGPV